MSEQLYDLTIRAGRVFCAASGLDGPGEVAVRDGRIVASGSRIEGSAEKTLEFPDGLLLPGLVDLHAHPARGGSKFGVDPDTHFLPRGVTTVLSQGDAGANNLDLYREQVLKGARTRVLLALNLAAPGESKAAGCFADLADADVASCVAAIEANPEGIWGIAVNTSVPCCADNDPDEILRRGLEAAERTGLPLLFGSRRHSDRPLVEQLARLRPGDLLTYCFHGQEEGLVCEGHVRDEVWQARERGIFFDVGHGMASFSFAVAETAIAEGFWPDTISTDQYQRHVGSQPQHDLPRTLSKLVAAGMPEREALERATRRPAEMLGLEGEVGTLRPGACADLVILRWNNSAEMLCDAEGASRPGGCWESMCVVRAGEMVEIG